MSRVSYLVSCLTSANFFVPRGFLANNKDASSREINIFTGLFVKVSACFNESKLPRCCNEIEDNRNLKILHFTIFILKTAVEQKHKICKACIF